MAVNCALCPYWVELVPGDLGYDPLLDSLKGYCFFCPPVPNGEYRLELSDWPITLATDICALCRCRGCGSYTPPVPSSNFLLLETGDYILLETGDKIILG